jgi:hypothetical protein
MTPLDRYRLKRASVDPGGKKIQIESRTSAAAQPNDIRDGQQGLHQSHGASYEDAGDDGHFSIFVWFRVEEDTPLPGRISLLHFNNTFIICILNRQDKITFIFSVFLKRRRELPRTNLINKAASSYGYIILGRTGGMSTLSATEF